MTVAWTLWMTDQLGCRSILIRGALGGSTSLYVVGRYVGSSKPSTKGDGGINPRPGPAAIVFFYI